MLHRRRVELGADPVEHRFTLNSVVVEHAHLDELVGAQIDVDLVQDARGEPVLADGHDRVQMMRLRAQRTALRRRQYGHACILRRALEARPGYLMQSATHRATGVSFDVLACAIVVMSTR